MDSAHDKNIPSREPSLAADTPRRSCGTDERDTLVSRVVDGEADPRDWARLRAIAEDDPAVWCEITATQADHEALRDAVESSIAASGSIDLPDFDAETHGRGVSGRLDAVRSWGGWAAAAAILLVWATGGLSNLASQPGASSRLTPVNTAGIIPASITPEQLRDQYVERGREQGLVVGEAGEPIVLEARPIADGSGVEVFVIRQIVERQIVDGVYRATLDESGQPAPIAVRITEPFVGKHY